MSDDLAEKLMKCVEFLVQEHRSLVYKQNFRCTNKNMTDGQQGTCIDLGNNDTWTCDACRAKRFLIELGELDD